MSQQNRQDNSNQPKKPELDADIVKAIIEQQGKRIQLEEKQLQLEEKKLHHNSKLAELSMQHNADYLKSAPRDKRKLLRLQIIAVVVILVIVLFFIGYCLRIGKDEIVNKVIVLFTHTATLLIGLFIGKKIKRKEDERSNDDGPEEAEIV